MEKVEFQKLCRELFKKNNFTVKGTHYYKDVAEDMLLIFGLQHSAYSQTYFVEIGFAIKSINPYMPYPKFSFSNIRCGSVVLADGNYSFEYPNMDMNDWFILQNAIQNEIDQWSACHTVNDLKEYVLAPNSCVLVVGPQTRDYLGFEVPRSNFMPCNPK